AIMTANPNEHLWVKSGIYYENVMVDKALTITGEDMATTIIDGMGNMDVVQVMADGVTIDGFTLTNSGPMADDAGLRVLVSNGFRGYNLDITNNANGLFADTASGLEIYNSSISGASNFDITLMNSQVSTYNTAFNIGMVDFRDPASSLWVYNWLTIYVEDTGGKKIMNANVEVQDKFSTTVAYWPMQPVGMGVWGGYFPDMYKDQGIETLYSPYTIHASNFTHTGSLSGVPLDAPNEVIVVLTEIMPGGPVRNLDLNKDYLSINAALEDGELADGHTITVANGQYEENLEIMKGITLIGEDPLETIIWGNGGLEVVMIRAVGVTISGFYIQNGPVGVRTDMNGHQLYLENNRIEGVNEGVIIDNIAAWRLSNNTIIANDGVRITDTLAGEMSYLSGNTINASNIGVDIFGAMDELYISGNELNGPNPETKGWIPGTGFSFNSTNGWNLNGNTITGWNLAVYVDNSHGWNLYGNTINGWNLGNDGVRIENSNNWNMHNNTINGWNLNGNTAVEIDSASGWNLNDNDIY
ncbi:MAG: hypothetical protein KAT70_04465, partial [Thermoplasmata archaeon]|nr:hypothetical protein [Thermoplasmata archaeon]